MALSLLCVASIFLVGAKISEHAKVKLLSGVSAKGWYKVKYNGKTAYVAPSYLVDKYEDAPEL